MFPGTKGNFIMNTWKEIQSWDSTVTAGWRTYLHVNQVVRVWDGVSLPEDLVLDDGAIIPSGATPADVEFVATAGCGGEIFSGGKYNTAARALESLRINIDSFILLEGLGDRATRWAYVSRTLVCGNLAHREAGSFVVPAA